MNTGDQSGPESPHQISSTVRSFFFITGAILVAAVSLFVWQGRGGRETAWSPNAGPDAPLSCFALRLDGYPLFAIGDGGDNEPALEGNFSSRDLDTLEACLGPYETLVIVEGLPEVSGLIDPNTLSWWGRETVSVQAVSVFSAFADQVGQCNVSGTQAFQTKVTQSWIRGSSQEDFSDARPLEVLTVDVGVSRSGDPFMAVTLDEVRGDSGQPETTHNYVSEAWNSAENRGDNAEIEVSVSETNEGRGQAIFRTMMHNNRKYFPHTEDFWQGDPIYDATITVICG